MCVLFTAKNLFHTGFEESQINAYNISKQYPINLDFTFLCYCRPFGSKRVILRRALAVNVVEKFCTEKLTTFQHVVKS